MPWRVDAVQVLPDYRLAIRFLDGTEGEVAMVELIHSSNAGVFAQLRSLDVFAKAFVAYGAVTWPGEIDLAPDAMYQAIKANGEWVLR